MTTARIDIDLDAKCRRCKKGGATQGGYCLACIIKRMDEGAYDDIFEDIRKGKKQADSSEVNQ